MSEVVPISHGHPSLKRLRRLSRRRRDRQHESAFVIEGPSLLIDALRTGVDVQEIVAEPGLDAAVLAEIGALAPGVPIRTAPAGALARAVDSVTPQPVAAIAALPSWDWRAALDATTLAVVLSGVSDPGNAGTLLRTAEAVGAGAVLFCDDSVDPHNPKCVRASAGSLFRVAVATVGRAVEVLERAGGAGMARVATVARGGVAPDDVCLTDPFALVLGSEAHGLGDDLVPHVDHWITIPMLGRIESLNVAMAGTVIAFEALRQRRARP